MPPKTRWLKRVSLQLGVRIIRIEEKWYAAKSTSTLREEHMLKRTGSKAIAMVGMAIGFGVMVQAADQKTMSADQAAMMQKMQQLGAPGPNHQMLQQSAGRW